MDTRPSPQVETGTCTRCHRTIGKPDDHSRWCPLSPDYDDGTRYKIVRMFSAMGMRKRKVPGMDRLTLKQAQAHCNNPETSSRTATGSAAKRITRRVGCDWFDGYEIDN